MTVQDVAIKLAENEPLTDDERHLASKILMAVSQSYYERSGGMFICGASSSDFPPETISVCPAYGADIQSTVMYKRIK